MKLEKKLHENVYYYENVFDNPQWVIDSLNHLDKDENTYEAITKWYNWLASNNEKDCFGQKKDLYYSQRNSVNGDNANLTKEVIELMKNNISDLCYKFVEDRELDMTPNVSPFLDMCKYTKGGNLGLHFDQQDGDKSLLYSIVLYFNNDFEGGEVSFIVDENKIKNNFFPGDDMSDVKNQSIVDFWIKPEPGSALVFPSSFPYLHKSHPIKSGNKYMSTAFIFVEGFDAFNKEHQMMYRGK